MPAPLGRSAAARTASAARTDAVPAAAERVERPALARRVGLGARVLVGAGRVGQGRARCTPATASSRRNGLGVRGAFCVDHHDPLSSSSVARAGERDVGEPSFLLGVALAVLVGEGAHGLVELAPGSAPRATAARAARRGRP